MERIVLGYDASPASVAALTWVAARARTTGADVQVVTVAGRLARDRAAGLEHLGEAEAYLRDQSPGVRVDLHRLEGGVDEALTELGADAELVVVGINPGHPVRAALAGALPLRITTHASVPVVMVPAGWVDVGEPITVGVATDASSDPALAFAAREAEQTERALRLVHAWLMPTPSFSGSTVLVAAPETVLAEHRAILDAATLWVMERYPTTGLTTELVRDSRSTALLRFAPRSSMLVIGTHRRGIVAGALTGSVAQEVLWRAECPVVVVPETSSGRED